jgi:hypothetical protein
MDIDIVQNVNQYNILEFLVQNDKSLIQNKFKRDEAWIKIVDLCRPPGKGQSLLFRFSNDF